MEMMNHGAFEMLSEDELMGIGGGGGPIANAINATVGGALVANGGIVGGALAVAGTLNPIGAILVGGALIAGGAYCIKNALD